MKKYSPLTFDFKELNLSFDYERERVVLHGNSQAAAVTLNKGISKPYWNRNKRKRLLKQSDKISFHTTQVTTLQNSIDQKLASYSDVFGALPEHMTIIYHSNLMLSPSKSHPIDTFTHKKQK